MKCSGNTLLAPLDEPTVRQVGGESRRREGDRKSFSRPQQTIKILKCGDYMSCKEMLLRSPTLGNLYLLAPLKKGYLENFQENYLDKR